eukprot:TRINITY_DN998_c0_g1_i4.p1 TRINITY_DN998_c0_g1~~TRINITY_DN998_c0_g1_i4.p1  ORF type:complete len:177 (+),score=79.14 TRINITY_DN998_c0_g1_i4:142-672(+)
MCIRDRVSTQSTGADPVSMAFTQRGKNNAPVSTSNLFGALLEDDKKTKKKKEKERKLKEAADAESLKSLSPMPNATSMNWADAAEDDDMFGSSPADWGDTPTATDEPIEEEEEEEPEEPEEEEEEVEEVEKFSSKVVAQEEEKQPVSYTHLRAHETPEHLVCRLLLEKKKKKKQIS